jgi:hypothetical protein
MVASNRDVKGGKKVVKKDKSGPSFLTFQFKLRFSGLDY